jgi:hypothetical protein
VLLEKEGPAFKNSVKPAYMQYCVSRPNMTSGALISLYFLYESKKSAKFLGNSEYTVIHNHNQLEYKVIWEIHLK